jgi:hypothetical protein
LEFLIVMALSICIYLAFSKRESSSGSSSTKPREPIAAKPVPSKPKVETGAAAAAKVNVNVNVSSFQRAAVNTSADKKDSSASKATGSQSWQSIKFAIVGLQYFDVSFDTKERNNFTDIALRREPTNRHDSNAVEVFARGEKVGYINKEAAVIISAVLRAGQTYTVEFVEHFPQSISMRFRYR